MLQEAVVMVTGWMPYCGAFYRGARLPLPARINAYLMCWLSKKFKLLAPKKKARTCWERVTPAPSALRPPSLGAQLLVVRMTGAVYRRLLRRI
jgi:hypothetical protein